MSDPNLTQEEIEAYRERFECCGPLSVTQVERAGLLCDLALLALSAKADAITRCANEVPTTWLDPLLTGPTAVLKGNGGTWGCRDIEALLRGIQDRIRALRKIDR